MKGLWRLFSEKDETKLRKAITVIVAIGSVVFILANNGWTTTAYAHLSLPLFLAIGIVYVCSRIYRLILERAFPATTMSLWKLLGVRGAGNAHFYWVHDRRVRIVMFILILASMPNLTYLEEWIFRRGTGSWGEAIIRSLLFGAIHFIVGADVASCLFIFLGGMMLSQLYFSGGLELAAMGHFQWNIFLIALSLVISQIRRLRDVRRANLPPQQ